MDGFSVCEPFSDPVEERGLSAAAFLNSHFHSLHVSNELHLDSDLVTLVPDDSLQPSIQIHALNMTPNLRVNNFPDT